MHAEYLDALTLQALGQHTNLRAFPTPLAAVKDDELAAQMIHVASRAYPTVPEKKIESATEDTEGTERQERIKTLSLFSVTSVHSVAKKNRESFVPSRLLCFSNFFEAFTPSPHIPHQSRHHPFCRPRRRWRRGRFELRVLGRHRLQRSRRLLARRRFSCRSLRRA